MGERPDQLSALLRLLKSREAIGATCALAGILGVYSLASQFYLSQTIDDMLDVTLMKEFPRLLASGYVTSAWTFPFRIDLRGSFDLDFLASLFGNVVNAFVGNWVLTQRVVAFLLVLGTAAAMYFAIRRLGGTPEGALVGAVAFGFCNEFVMRMPSHLSLLGGFVFPLLLVALVEDRKYSTGVLLGLAYWSSPFFGIMALLLTAMYLLWEFVRTPGRVEVRLSKYIYGAAIFALMAGPLFPLGLPAPPAQAVNTLRDLFWRNSFAYFAPGPAQVQWEQEPSYLGLVTILLAVYGFGRKPGRFVGFLFVVAGVFAAFSLATPLVWPFTALREVTRFSVVAAFALALVVGLTFSLPQRFSRPAKGALTALVLVLLVADTLVAAPGWYSAPAPFPWNDPGLAAIAGAQQGAAEVHFPILPSSAGLIYYQYYGSVTGNYVVDGETSGLAGIQALDQFVVAQPFLSRFYVANVTDKFALSYNVTSFAAPTNESDLSLLRQAGIEYIVLHPSIYAPVGGTAAAESYLGSLQARGWLQLLSNDSQMVVYRIAV